MLVYVAHTKERWYKFLASMQVITPTTITQPVAALLAIFGTFTFSYRLLWWFWSWSGYFS
jgi:hypothetical protein